MNRCLSNTNSGSSFFWVLDIVLVVVFPYISEVV